MLEKDEKWRSFYVHAQWWSWIFLFSWPLFLPQLGSTSYRYDAWRISFLSLWWSWAVVLVPSEDSISLKSSWTRQSQRCRFLEEAAGGDRRRLILQTWQVEDLRNRFERSGQTVHSTFRLQSICHWGCPQTHFEAEGRSEGEKGTEEKQKRLLFQNPAHQSVIRF